MEPTPARGPVVAEHVVACPERVQVIGPAGAAAPLTPETMAVKVIVSPRFGVAGAPVTLIDAVD